jgi:hypothetical protein
MSVVAAGYMLALAQDEEKAKAADTKAKAEEKPVKYTVVKTGNTDDIGDEPEKSSTITGEGSGDAGKQFPIYMRGWDKNLTIDIVASEEALSKKTEQPANVIGKMFIRKDGRGRLISMSIRPDTGTPYRLYIDEKAKEMEDLHNVDVEINGRERIKAGVKVLHVDSWRKVIHEGDMMQ